MKTFIFLGPTLGIEDARRELDATYCPPAARGDVYRAVGRGARVIGLVDGYFDRTPSVWHREILWAMAEGVHVFGAASMGALRAAELEEFGMEGVGYVHSAFSTGLLCDDDEVAVAHATGEYGYRPASEAMINVRATLAAAAHQGVLSAETTEILEHQAKDMFYADRTYDRLCRSAIESGASVRDIDGLRDWLSTGRIDVKRSDALHMLRVIRERGAVSTSKKVSFRFEHTLTWEALLRQLSSERSADAHGDGGDDDAELVLDELRLDGRFVEARRVALGRLVGLQMVHQSGKPLDDEAYRAALLAFRRERGLLDADDLRRWLEDNALDASGLERVIRDEARLAWLDTSLAHESAQYLVDSLRLHGQYAPLAVRAREKQEQLSRLGANSTSVAAAREVDDVALWRWYFTERLARSVPGDLGEYARAAGFRDLAAMRDAVLREHLLQIFKVTSR